MGTAKGTRPQSRRLQKRKTIIVSLARFAYTLTLQSFDLLFRMCDYSLYVSVERDIIV